MITVDDSEKLLRSAADGGFSASLNPVQCRALLAELDAARYRAAIAEWRLAAAEHSRRCDAAVAAWERNPAGLPLVLPDAPPKPALGR